MRLYGVSMVLFILYLQILAVSLSAQARRTKKPKCRRGQSPELDGCVRRKGRSKANPTTSANEVNVPSMEPPRGPHCPPCSEISCFPLQQHECEGGLTTGYCGCCSVCAKLEGEKCGGRHYHFGKCDKNLECYQPTSLERRRSLGTPRIVVPSGTNVEESEVNESEGTCRPVPQCKPECTPEFCRTNKKAVCSARNTAVERRDCQGQCQLTSCGACLFQHRPTMCKKCASNDLKCIKKFGRCVKKLFRKRRSKKRKNSQLSSSEFVCWVPECKGIA